VACVSWARIDDKFPRHRRVRQLRRDVPSKWLYVVALCFCCEHLTDGHIQEFDLEQIIGDADMPRVTALRSVTRLVAAGLWVDHGGGHYEIRDFLDYNPSGSKVKAEREAAKQRMRQLRAVRTSVERSLREAS
jgi:hypothetical protein